MLNVLLNKNIEKKRFKNGIEILSAVNDLVLTCIQENVYIIPTLEDENDKNNLDIKENLNNDNNTEVSTEIIKYKDIINKDEINNFREKYVKYILNHGYSFKDLLSKCFGINQNEFTLEIKNHNLEIIIKDNECDEFLLNFHKKISKKCSEINKDFEKKRIIAIKNRNNNLRLEKSKKKLEKVIIEKKEFKI